MGGRGEKERKRAISHSSQCFIASVTKDMAYAILSAGWCIWRGDQSDNPFHHEQTLYHITMPCSLSRSETERWEQIIPTSRILRVSGSYVSTLRLSSWTGNTPINSWLVAVTYSLGLWKPALGWVNTKTWTQYQPACWLLN